MARSVTSSEKQMRKRPSHDQSKRAGLSRRSLLRGLTGASSLVFLGPGCSTSDDSGGGGGDGGGSDGVGSGGDADLPLDGSGGGAGAGLPRVAIVGAGAAGITTAWLLDGKYDVVLIEKAEQVGGNVITVPVDVGGEEVFIDIGAQYFHPGPYPVYTQLLTHLGLYLPDDLDHTEHHGAPSSITIFARDEETPRFVSPVLPDRAWPLSEPWNTDGLSAFQTVTAAAVAAHAEDASFDETLENWLIRIGLPDKQRTDLMVPWVASLFSGKNDEGAAYSARASMVFLARAAPKNPLDVLYYNTLRRGMVSALDILLAQTTTVSVKTAAAVSGLQRIADGTVGGGAEGAGGWKVSTDDGQTGDFAHVVLAAPGYASAALIDGIDAVAAQHAACAGIAFHETDLVLHRDDLFVPSNDKYRSFLNVEHDGAYGEATMRMATALAPTPSGKPVNVWKSWARNRYTDPKDEVARVKFKHMLPTPAAIAAQDKLRALQGDEALYFAGGWTQHYDSQETAVTAARLVAEKLGTGHPDRLAVLADPAA
jgi:predicted NAD/FAD-binding protein